MAVTIKDSDGNTAAEDARRRGHEDIVAMIEAKIKGNFILLPLLLELEINFAIVSWLSEHFHSS